MMKNAIIVLGIILVLAAIIVFTYGTVAFQPPLMGTETTQGTNVNYLAFFSFALGGGGILILAFSVFQWFRKRRP
jgi:hypothetical protein